MTRIFAIAGIAIRGAIRSRMVLSLLVLLAITVVGLPLTVKGDGTAEGQLRVTITYSLGAAFALLALTSLWAGALSIAQEIEEKQIQLLAAKPVKRTEIWAGKWVGLMTINTALLLAAALATALLLPRKQLDAQSEPGHDWRAVYRPIMPTLEDYSKEARALLNQRRADGEIPKNVDDETALRVLQQEVLLREATVAPGQQRKWTIVPPRTIRADETLRIRFRYSSSAFGIDAAVGRWQVGTPSQPTAWQSVSTNIPELYQTLEIPAAVLADAREVVITFTNEDPNGVTLVFNPSDGLRLQLPAGSFAQNYARAFLVLLLRLGFLTALGVTAGALFSSPVALFIAVSLMAMSQFAGMSAGTAPAQRGIQRVINAPAYALRAALKPLASPPVLDAVATGMLVEDEWILRVAGVQLLLYGGALALLGASVLNRRELALPAI